MKPDVTQMTELTHLRDINKNLILQIFRQAVVKPLSSLTQANKYVREKVEIMKHARYTLKSPCVSLK